MPNDYYVMAWNVVDDADRPVYEVDQEMTFAQYEAHVAGKYAFSSVRLLRAISASAIDRALKEQGW